MSKNILVKASQLQELSQNPSFSHFLRYIQGPPEAKFTSATNQAWRQPKL